MASSCSSLSVTLGGSMRLLLYTAMQFWNYWKRTTGLASRGDDGSSHACIHPPAPMSLAGIVLSRPSLLAYFTERTCDPAWTLSPSRVTSGSGRRSFGIHSCANFGTIYGVRTIAAQQNT